MASAAPAHHLLATLQVQMFDHDPGRTDATITNAAGTTVASIKGQDMRDVSHFLVAAAPSVIVGGMTELEIVAATDSSFTTPVIIKTSGTVANDALGDYTVLECTVEDLQAVSTADLRYAAARMTCSNAGDACVVIYVAKSKRPRLNLTASVQA